MILELKRYPEYFNTTPGELWIDDHRICYTVELPWKNNRERISCVPTGLYGLVLDMSKRFERVLPRILDVPGRAGIRLHAANQSHELEGCIAPVNKLYITNRKIFGNSSAITVVEVMRVIRAYSIEKIRITEI